MEFRGAENHVNLRLRMDSSDPTLRGTIIAIMVVVAFCFIGLNVVLFLVVNPF